MKYSSKKIKKYQEGGQQEQVSTSQPPQEDMQLLQQFLGMKVQERKISQEEAQQVIEKYMQSNEEERMQLISMVQEQMPNLNPQPQGLSFNNSQ